MRLQVPNSPVGLEKPTSAHPSKGCSSSLFHPGDNTPIATTRTNEEGGFRFSGLATGRYRVKASGVVEYGDERIVRLDPAAKAQVCLVVE